MPKVNWQTLPGRIVAGKYELQHVIRAAEDSADFRAIETGTQKPAEVALGPPNAALDPRVVADLEHVNLRRVFEAGTEEIYGISMDYAVTEAADGFLAEELQNAPLAPELVRRIAADCVQGLAYLHARGFVYMNLRPDSVVRVGNRWKLAEPEFAQKAGNVSPAETRPLLSRSPYAPPEAFNGVISPAWDVWSLGFLIKRLLVPHDSRPANQRRPVAQLPAPFDEVVQHCLQPDPAERPNLQQLASRLGAELDLPAAVSAVDSDSEAVRPARRTRAYGAGEERARRKVRTYSVPAVENTPDAEAPVPAGEPMLDVTAAGVGDHAIYDTSLPSTPEPPVYRTAYDRAPVYEAETERPVQHPLRTRVAVALGGLLIGALLYVLIWRPGPGAAGSGELTKNRTTEPARNTQPASPSPVPGGSEAKSDTSSERSVPPSAKDREQGIRALLAKWADSTRNLDLESHAQCYAPRVERFFRRRNVTRDDVLKEKRPLFADIQKVRRLQISNVKFESLKPDRAVLSLRKEWDFAGARPFAGAEIERLTVAWINGRWQITGEEERKVEWIRRAPSRTRTEAAL